MMVTKFTAYGMSSMPEWGSYMSGGEPAADRDRLWMQHMPKLLTGWVRYLHGRVFRGSRGLPEILCGKHVIGSPVLGLLYTGI